MPQGLALRAPAGSTLAATPPPRSAARGSPASTTRPQPVMMSLQLAGQDAGRYLPSVCLGERKERGSVPRGVPRFLPRFDKATAYETSMQAVRHDGPALE